MKKCHCCKDKTEAWGIIGMQYYCKKCRDYRKENGKFPDKEKLKMLRKEGLW